MGTKPMNLCPNVNEERGHGEGVRLTESTTWVRVRFGKNPMNHCVRFPKKPITSLTETVREVMGFSEEVMGFSYNKNKRLYVTVKFEISHKRRR